MPTMHCRIGRLIAGDGTQDLDLDGDYFVLYGRRTSNPTAGLLQTHLADGLIPLVSEMRYNPTEQFTSLPSGVTMPVCRCRAS